MACTGVWDQIVITCNNIYQIALENKKAAISAVCTFLFFICVIIYFACFHGISKGSEVLFKNPIFDGANYFLENVAMFADSKAKNVDFSKENVFLNTDKPHAHSTTNGNSFSKSFIGSQVWSIDLECDNNTVDFILLNEAALEIFDDSRSTFVSEFTDVKMAMANKKVSNMFSISGNYPMDKDFILLNFYKKLHVKFIHIHHSKKCQDGKNLRDDTDDVKSFVKSINKAGMVIDITGCPVKDQETVLINSEHPVVYTADSKEINKDIVKKLEKNNGVYLITFKRDFFSEIDNVIETLQKVNELTKSCNHVGLASGFDSKDELTKELTDVSKFRILFDKLYEKDSKTWNEECLIQLSNGNLLRVLKAVASA